jgi:hypothetical protein
LCCWLWGYGAHYTRCYCHYQRTLWSYRTCTWRYRRALIKDSHPYRSYIDLIRIEETDKPDGMWSGRSVCGVQSPLYEHWWGICEVYRRLSLPTIPKFAFPQNIVSRFWWISTKVWRDRRDSGPEACCDAESNHTSVFACPDLPLNNPTTLPPPCYRGPLATFD